MRVLAAIIACVLLAPAAAEVREHGLYLRQQGADTFVAGDSALAAALGVLAIGLLALIPWLGNLIAMLALVAGMGALLLQARAPG